MQAINDNQKPFSIAVCAEPHDLKTLRSSKHPDSSGLGYCFYLLLHSCLPQYRRRYCRAASLFLLFGKCFQNRSHSVKGRNYGVALQIGSCQTHRCSRFFLIISLSFRNRSADGILPFAGNSAPEAVFRFHQNIFSKFFQKSGHADRSAV